MIRGTPDKDLFVSEFNLEDGMTLEEYITYEKLQFDSLSNIYDLDEDFSIQILHEHNIGTKDIVFFYIINKYKKIVCKMNLTIDKKSNLLTSNDSFVQIVPKFTIENNKISQIGLAIKPRFSLKKVFCNQFDLLSFHPGDNYNNDFFYTAKFEGNDDVQNSLIYFTVVLDSEKIIIERKPVFFDQFSLELKPFLISDNHLKLLDDKYPVHLSLWSKWGENSNYEYPRNLELSLNEINLFTVTDSIDNDWIIKI